jgi:hypothetical protein
MFGLIDRGVGHIIFNMTQTLRQGGLTRKHWAGGVPAAILSYRRNASNSVSSARSPVARAARVPGPGIHVTLALRTS